MIDVHCHLNFHAFEHDADTVINEALQGGVSSIINAGTQLDSSRKALNLAMTYEKLYAILGIHPHHADKVGHEENWEKNLENMAKEKKVVAIGEIGLDYFEYKANGIVDPAVQKDVFEKQIAIAHRLRLPLQIHNRHAGKDILEILQHHRAILSDPPGMFHCFAGNLDVLRGALNLGFCIGFDGNITYPGLAPRETVTLSALAKTTPLDMIVTETDSPFLTPIPYRGTRNKPSYVIIVGEFLAKIKGLSFQDIEEQTEKNANRIFRLL